jgi:hypothetical protein
VVARGEATSKHIAAQGRLPNAIYTNRLLTNLSGCFENV